MSLFVLLPISLLPAASASTDPPPDVQAITPATLAAFAASQCASSATGVPATCVALDGARHLSDLADPDLAAVALAAAPGTIRGIVAKAGGVAARAPAAPAPTESPPAVTVTTETPFGSTRTALAGSAAGAALAAASPVAAAVGTTVEQQLSVLLSGLARFTQDRAKQEALGWALDTVGNEVCSPSDVRVPATGNVKATTVSLTDLRDEVGGQALRSFCTLAKGKRLSGYGAGEGTWRALQSAVDSDLRDLPGVVAGRQVQDVLNSSTPPTGLRDAFRTSFRRIVDGADPAQGLLDLGTALSSVTGTRADVAVHWAACALSVPGSLGAASASGTSSTASFTVAVVGSPACRVALDLDKAGGTPIDTALGLYATLGPYVTAIAGQWTALTTAVQAAKEDAGRFAASSQSLVDYLQAGDLSSKQVDDLRAKVEAQVRVGQSVLLKSLDVLDAGTGIANTALTALSHVATAPPTLTVATALLAKVQEASGLVRSVVSGDVGGALTRAAPYFEAACKDKACRQRADEIASLAGGVAAIATSKTPDDAAKAIAGVANPPGGWAQKGTRGRISFGLTSYAGVAAGLEWRNGPDGLQYDQDAQYFAYPTLTLPVGVDVTFGSGKGEYFTLFATAVDPAAFLQYDPAAGNALPPAKVTTALAPGARVRASIGRSPIGLSAGFVWRPGLRTASTDPFGPGADAFQLTFGIDIDATLFNLYRTHGAD